MIPQQSRRTFLQNASLLVAALPFAKLNGLAATSDPVPGPAILSNTPEILVNDSRVKLAFGRERMVIPDGLQPSMLCTKAGTLIVQSQNSQKPHPQQRIFYPYALTTVVSRDAGETWAEFPLKPDDNGVNLEGGIIQLRDGTILALETYVTPGDGPDRGAGLLYYSTDDWRTMQGPVDITLDIPGVNFHASSDDGGRAPCGLASASAHPRAAQWGFADDALRLVQRRQRTVGLHSHDDESTGRAHPVHRSGPALDAGFHRGCGFPCRHRRVCRTRAGPRYAGPPPGAVDLSNAHRAGFARDRVRG